MSDVKSRCCSRGEDTRGRRLPLIDSESGFDL